MQSIPGLKSYPCYFAQLVLSRAVSSFIISYVVWFLCALVACQQIKQPTTPTWVHLSVRVISVNWTTPFSNTAALHLVIFKSRLIHQTRTNSCCGNTGCLTVVPQHPPPTDTVSFMDGRGHTQSPLHLRSIWVAVYGDVPKDFLSQHRSIHWEQEGKRGSHMSWLNGERRKGGSKAGKMWLGSRDV